MIAEQYKCELADELNYTTRQIEGYWFAFSCINRVAHIRSYFELSQACIEDRQGDTFYYSELPQRLKDMVHDAISKSKPLGHFFGDIDSKENLRKFIKKLQSERVSPHEYCFNGVVTYRCHQRGKEENHLPTVEVIEYEDNKSKQYAS